MQVLAVEGLHRLELKEPAARRVGGDQVLGELGVRAGRGAEGGLHPLAEKG